MIIHFLVPQIFHKLYTIHGINYSNFISSVYILLKRKRRYIPIISECLWHLNFLRPQLNVKSIMFVFEKAAMNV